MKESPDGPVITDVLDAKVPDGALTEGRIVNASLVEDVLSETLRVIQPRGAHIVTTAGPGGRDVMLYRRRINRASRAEARRSLPNLPSLGFPNKEKMVMDLVIHDPEGIGPEMDVLLVAAHRDRIKARQELFRDVGIEVDTVEVDLCALHNLANHVGLVPENDGSLVVHLHIGAASAQIAVAVDGKLALGRRVVSTGMAALTTAVQESGRIGSEDPLVAVTQEDSNGMFDDLIEHWAQTVSEDVMQSVGQVESTDEAQGQIVLSGAGSMVPNIARVLASASGMDVDLLDPFSALTVETELPAETRRAGPIYALAAAYALRGLS